ncbi:MAG: hypothetical protein IT184_04990 [Acidobacteria bacterium]|nr:hypothetical protein [Acidobacteriota bacterium]
MRGRLVVFLGFLCVAFLSNAPAASRREQQAAPFRSATEIVRVDVSVLDRERRPVRGWTAADFTLLLDGQPQRIVAFEEVGAAGRGSERRPGSDQIAAADLATSDRTAARLLVVVLDDYSLAEARALPGDVGQARSAALAALDSLDADDLGAIVFASTGGVPEGFTTDRGRLRDAISRLTVVPDSPVKVEGMT